LREGLRDYISAAKRMGLLLAVASSASRRWVVDHLARFDLLEEFDCIRTVEDVARAKPEPDLFLAALDETCVAARDAVAFEDSPNGIRAARRAGIACVAVPNSVTVQLPLDQADLVIDSFEAVPLEQVLSRVAQARK
jgi:HAD superfamily hydrolase (TIGR01509 family)